MRGKLLVNVMLAGASVFFLTGSPASAQVPVQQRPGMGQADRTGTAPGNPEATTDTMRMQNKMDDKKFVRDAAVGGMTEVELGKLAQEKGSSEGVKQFGQKMVDDHTKANDELKKVASDESISIPDALDAKHQARVNKLSKLSGTAFDRAYISDQLKDHEQDVKEFQQEAQNGSDAAVKNFAAKTLPTLQGHLSMVKDLSKTKSAKAQ